MCVLAPAIVARHHRACLGSPTSRHEINEPDGQQIAKYFMCKVFAKSHHLWPQYDVVDRVDISTFKVFVWVLHRLATVATESSSTVRRRWLPKGTAMMASLEVGVFFVRFAEQFPVGGLPRPTDLIERFFGHDQISQGQNDDFARPPDFVQLSP